MSDTEWYWTEMCSCKILATVGVAREKRIPWWNGKKILNTANSVPGFLKKAIIEVNREFMAIMLKKKLNFPNVKGNVVEVIRPSQTTRFKQQSFTAKRGVQYLNECSCMRTGTHALTLTFMHNMHSHCVNSSRLIGYRNSMQLQNQFRSTQNGPILFGHTSCINRIALNVLYWFSEIYFHVLCEGFCIMQKIH